MENKKDISSVIAFITPGILQLLMRNRGLSLESAAEVLYNSMLYKTLEDENTKVWHLGYPILYDLLEEELTTGDISLSESAQQTTCVRRKTGWRDRANHN